MTRSINDADHFLHDCYKHAKGAFKFSMTFPDPDDSKKEHSAFCWLFYFPHVKGESTRPVLVNDDEGHNNDQTIMQVFWQNRLTPLTDCKEFPFLKNLASNAPFPGCPTCFQWRNRLVGLIFFNQQFLHVSSNKLYISVAGGLQPWLDSLHQHANSVESNSGLKYVVFGGNHNKNNVLSSFKRLETFYLGVCFPKTLFIFVNLVG